MGRIYRRAAVSKRVVPAADDATATIMAQQWSRSRSSWFRRGRIRESERPKMKLLLRAGRGEAGMMLKLDRPSGRIRMARALSVRNEWS
jgi:hypothetical protein